MKTAKTTNRRKFLLAAGLGGAGAAAALVTTSKTQPTREEVPAVDKVSGYRLTQHIEKYYKTTKV
ncbi:MAG TPA: twin-arginine translocation signal domain-containing protein [Usitatibacter sp.]|nr:twin-arginine translocation signal domain-containing protein [Usitatibacter sp.]